ncbi:MAG: LysM peptidoglycan-binding domain-containing M23 family metallopeptidase, partial [Candidatus Paceibacterota bacterium]
TVTKGQTVQGIANLYKVEIDEILSSNQINESAKLTEGQKLIVPGAEIQNEKSEIKSKPKTTTTGKSLAKTGSSIISSVAGFFTNPVPGSVRTRGVKPGHRGVDLAAPTGTAIHAAASGRVLAAKTGYSGGFGNMVIIQHSNGTKTLYAHMSKIGTQTGDQVSKGEVIGYVGSTGHSTGPHLHIEVLGGRNPF